MDNILNRTVELSNGETLSILQIIELYNDSHFEQLHKRKGNGQFAKMREKGPEDMAKDDGDGVTPAEKERAKIAQYRKDFNDKLSKVPKEVRKKMESLRIVDGKDNIFQPMNKEDADFLGKEPLPFRLKVGRLNRQKKVHKLSREKEEMLLATALYTPEFIGGKRENGYINFISSLSPDRNPLVLIDIEEDKEGFYDIVHYFFLDKKSRDKKEKE